MTVAVRDNRRPLVQFAKPTTKAGIPHLEAPAAVLERMLTLRLHLDAADAANGALAVIPGSHARGKRLPPDDRGTVLVACAAGDVLLMRPLLAHASGKSDPACNRHWRVVHLEFAADRELPDGVAWRDFIR
jgi:ectoine hydroxylase-related dioxygenase (phytanoyl-CoA dioxygenase family)